MNILPFSRCSGRVYLGWSWWPHQSLETPPTYRSERELLTEGPKFKRFKYTGENTVFIPPSLPTFLLYIRLSWLLSVLKLIRSTIPSSLVPTTPWSNPSLIRRGLVSTCPLPPSTRMRSLLLVTRMPLSRLLPRSCNSTRRWSVHFVLLLFPKSGLIPWDFVVCTVTYVL